MSKINYDNILITGGMGFIGLYVVEKFQREFPSSNIMILDAMKYSTTPINKACLNSNVTLLLQDINDKFSLFKNIKEFLPTVIIHMAAETNVDNSYNSSSVFIDTNVIGTHNLLECVRSLCPSCVFLHMSTDEVYGSSPVDSTNFMTEESELKPTNPYSASKASAEMLVHAYTISYNLKTFIIRCNNAYGPRQYPEKIIPKFSLFLDNNKKCTIHGNGNLYSRHYIHSADIANAIYIILTKGEIKQTPNIFNISSNDKFTNLEMVRNILKVLGRDDDFENSYIQIDDRPFNDTHYPIDCEKLSKLGFRQSIKWDDGIRETVLWYSKHGKNWWNKDVDKNIFLLVGGKGWIGGKLANILKEQNKVFYISKCRTENRDELIREIEFYRPTHVINSAGVTGRPNVDWCEDNKQTTIRSNVIGTLNVADICNQKSIHHLLFATGCIFEYDNDHLIGGKGFFEEDKPNFNGSFYSHTKALVEDLLKNFTTTCILRVRMPISDDLYPRNFITKIVNYSKVINIPNSMTVLTELLPISIIMAERKLTGVYNFCNPGAISHNKVLDMYKKYIDNGYTYINFTIEEQNKILKAGRSNNMLDHTKLARDLPDIHIDEINIAMEKVFRRMTLSAKK